MTAVYIHSTGATVLDGAMPYLAGPFIPDNSTQWPAIDAVKALLQVDLAVMLGNDLHAGNRHRTQGHCPRRVPGQDHGVREEEVVPFAGATAMGSLAHHSMRAVAIADAWHVAGIYAGCLKHGRLDKYNIGHRHKRSDAC